MSYKSLSKFCKYYYNDKVRAETIKKFDDILTISSGINHLPMISVIKKSIVEEYDEDSFYTSYTDHCGSKLFLASVYFELKEMLGNTMPKIAPQGNICRTFGATGALSQVFQYFGVHKLIKKALVLGLNYSLFTLWCEKHHITHFTLQSNQVGRVLPTIDETKSAISSFQPDLIIVSQPTNPSGEVYSKEEMEELVRVIFENDLWFLYDDVPNLYNVYDGKMTHLFECFSTKYYPQKLIFISSFSKCRSMAGMRLGYVICNEDIYDYIYNKNDELFWSPQSNATSALGKDVFYRTLLRKIDDLDESEHRKYIDKAKKRFALTVKMLSPYSEDVSMLDDNTKYIFPKGDLYDELMVYKKNLKEIYDIYDHNWKKILEILRPYALEIIPSHHGFNHCIKIKSHLSEEQFCLQLFDEAGIDIYSESVFSHNDNTTKKEFYIRISCALESKRFERGLERLVPFLRKNCHIVNSKEDEAFEI